jgi:pimeloyl-ACP methyl ester carboxylesterase
VTCHDEPAELDAYLYGLYPGARGSAEWLDAAATAARGFGARCLELTGPLLGHVDTESAARDLDLLRAVLGDTKLNYLGYSYGTLLGQVYAQLFPQRTGRLVFDGAVDPALSTFDATAAQAVGFEGVLRTFLAECLGSSDCPFDGTVDDALTRIRSLLDELDRRPLPSTSDGRVLGSDAMFSAIVLPLYDPANWGYLRELFATVLAGSSDYAFQLADSYHGRNADGSYRLNQTEAFISINCLDSREPADPAQLRTEADELARRAPVFGPQMAWGAVGCSQWPVPSKGARGAIAAAGSADILVVGTTHDPATPYAWAVRVASQLENGHLVSYDGDGHTAYNKSNECVDNAVDAFLLEGAVPAADPQC